MEDTEEPSVLGSTDGTQGYIPGYLGHPSLQNPKASGQKLPGSSARTVTATLNILHSQIANPPFPLSYSCTRFPGTGSHAVGTRQTHSLHRQPEPSGALAT